jgi:hypothetical protein
MIWPAVQMRPEVEKILHVLDLPLPSEANIFSMQQDLAKGVSPQDENSNPVEIEVDLSSARAAKGLTEFEAQQMIRGFPQVGMGAMA